MTASDVRWSVIVCTLANDDELCLRTTRCNQPERSMMAMNDTKKPVSPASQPRHHPGSSHSGLQEKRGRSARKSPRRSRLPDRF